MNNVAQKKEAQEGMLKGIKLATSLIRSSYGPQGDNISIENEFYPFHTVVNDARTIIQAIHSTDKLEKRGLNFQKELMDKAEKDSADGRKTTCIIGEEVFEGGLSIPNKNQLKRDLDDLIPFIEQKINESKRDIDVDEVWKVAEIAGESKELGQILGKIYQDIGKDGIIIPEGSGTYQTYYSVIEGIRFTGTGYLSPFMVYDEEARKNEKTETRAIYTNPTILVTKRKISHINDIDPLLNLLQNQGKKDLVIFTDDMDSGVASMLVATHKAKVMNILIIKAPVLWKNYVFEDFAKVTGATIVEDASGINFKNLKVEHLGTCARLEVTEDETTILGGQDISEHIAHLKTQEGDDSKRRLAWLTAKTAILKLGANNESELSHFRLKCYDAISSSRLALRDGVVKGGGVCLYKVAQELPDTVAGKLLKTALEAPIKQIMANEGQENGSMPEDFGENVIDSAAVIKNAVRNGVSLASTMLTLGGDISLPEKTPEQITIERLQGKGMQF